MTGRTEVARRTGTGEANDGRCQGSHLDVLFTTKDTKDGKDWGQGNDWGTADERR